MDGKFPKRDLSLSRVALNIKISSACNECSLFVFIAASHLISYSHVKALVVFVYLLYSNSLHKPDLSVCLVH